MALRLQDDDDVDLVAQLLLLFSLKTFNTMERYRLTGRNEESYRIRDRILEQSGSSYPRTWVKGEGGEGGKGGERGLDGNEALIQLECTSGQ